MATLTDFPEVAQQPQQQTHLVKVVLGRAGQESPTEHSRVQQQSAVAGVAFGSADALGNCQGFGPCREEGIY